MKLQPYFSQTLDTQSTSEPFSRSRKAHAPLYQFDFSENPRKSVETNVRGDSRLRFQAAFQKLNLRTTVLV